MDYHPDGTVNPGSAPSRGTPSPWGRSLPLRNGSASGGAGLGRYSAPRDRPASSGVRSNRVVPEPCGGFVVRTAPANAGTTALSMVPNTTCDRVTMFGDTTDVYVVAGDVSSPLDSDAVEGSSHGCTVECGPRVPGVSDPGGVEPLRREGPQRREGGRNDEGDRPDHGGRDEGGIPSRDRPEARASPRSRAVVVG